MQSEEIQYEVLVEEKYGKKYKYTHDKYDSQIIEEGLQENQDNEEEDNYGSKNLQYYHLWKIIWGNFK